MTDMFIDCASDYSSRGANIKAAGCTGIIRYFNPLTNGRDSGKSLTRAEALRWQALNMPVGIVVEGYGLSNGTGVDGPSGTRDAREVIAWLPTVGLTPCPQLAVYFAVDTDATATQINENEVAYFDAIATVFNSQVPAARPRVGIYGSAASCLAMVGTRRAALAWVAGSTGWDDYTTYVNSMAWTLLQKIYPNEIWNGINADTNRVNAAHGSPGLWVPFSPVTASGLVPVPPSNQTNAGKVTPVPAQPGFFGSLYNSWKGL
jgi:hypothetical protein